MTNGKMIPIKKTNRLPHRGNNKIPIIQFISTIYKIFGKTQESISRDPRSIAKPYKWIDIIYVIMFNNTHWKYFFKSPGLTVKPTGTVHSTHSEEGSACCIELSALRWSRAVGWPPGGNVSVHGAVIAPLFFSGSWSYGWYMLIWNWWI